MCKKSENGAKLPISKKVMRLRNGTGATALAAQASRARLRWALRLWHGHGHGPIAATRAGLWCDFDKRHHCDSAVYNVVVCLFVRLSVRLSQAGIVPKWLNVRSRKQRHTIDRDSSFLIQKISAKFRRSHPNGGAK